MHGGASQESSQRPGGGTGGAQPGIHTDGRGPGTRLDGPPPGPRSGGPPPGRYPPARYSGPLRHRQIGDIVFTAIVWVLSWMLWAFEVVLLLVFTEYSDHCGAPDFCTDRAAYPGTVAMAGATFAVLVASVVWGSARMRRGRRAWWVALAGVAVCCGLLMIGDL